MLVTGLAVTGWSMGNTRPWTLVWYVPAVCWIVHVECLIHSSDLSQMAFWIKFLLKRGLVLVTGLVVTGWSIGSTGVLPELLLPSGRLHRAMGLDEATVPAYSGRWFAPSPGLVSPREWLISREAYSPYGSP